MDSDQIVGFKTHGAQLWIGWSSIGLTSIMYICLAVFGIINCSKYIIKQRGHLLMFYIFSIFVCLGRTGRMIAMTYHYLKGDPMHTVMSIMSDCLIQCSLAIVGLCLVVLMFQLYTFLHCNLIRLAAAENNPNGFQLDTNTEK